MAAVSFPFVTNHHIDWSVTTLEAAMSDDPLLVFHRECLRLEGELDDALVNDRSEYDALHRLLLAVSACELSIPPTSLPGLLHLMERAASLALENHRLVHLGLRRLRKEAEAKGLSLGFVRRLRDRADAARWFRKPGMDDWLVQALSSAIIGAEYLLAAEDVAHTPGPA